MQDQLNELHQQRGRLLERIAHQRTTLSQQLVPLQDALNFSARVTRVVQDAKAFLLRNPLSLMAGGAAVLLLRPRSVLRWAQRGLLAWRTWRSVSGLLPGFVVNKMRGWRW